MSRHADVGLVAPNAHLESLMRDLEQKGRMTAMEGFKAYGDAFVVWMRSKAEEGTGAEILRGYA